MLLNVSVNDPEIQRKIDEEVGRPFSFLERMMMGRNGSTKLIITGASIQIHNILILDDNPDVCKIELRPKGIIIRFRSLMETYGLIIPYYKLTLYKGQAQEYTLYRDTYFIRIGATDKSTHEFMKKVLHYKSEQSPEQPEDL